MTDDHDWVLVDLTCDPETAGYVSDVLWGAGVVAIEEIDNPDGSMTLRTSLGDDAAPTVDEIVAVHPTVSVRPVVVPRTVADSWRRFVGPTHVVDDVWLVPEWSPRPDGRCILVEPFDTFGLGNHPTTVLTLRAALHVSDATTRALDVGSGSGVLAVGLAFLHGCHVDANDIASTARTSLGHNARINGVEQRVEWLPDLESVVAGSYDLVMANILAPVLRAFAPRLVSATRQGGHIVLSGLRTEQTDEVVGHFAGCTETERTELEGWSAVTLVRNR